MAECNVLNLADLEPVSVGAIDSLGADAIRVLPGADLNGGELRLLNSNNAGSVTGFWFNEPIRVADGFSFRLDYDASDGTSDGFAMVIQNEKLENTVAGSGDNLGFSLAFDDYFAVAVDFCDSRLERNCDRARIRVEGRRNGGARETFIEVDEDLELDGRHTLRVDFVELPVRLLIISIDDTPVLTSLPDEIPAPLTDFLSGSLFAFVGVSGSNVEIPGTDIEALDLTLESLDFFLMNSLFRLDEERETIFTDAANGDFVNFLLVFVDTCNEPLGALPAGLVVEDIVATLVAQGDNDDIDATVSLDENNGQAFIEFVTPANVVETWDLDITIDQVRAQRTPVDAAVSSDVGGGGLSAAGLGLLITLLIVLVIGVILVATFTKRYRDKLKKNKENIEWGEAKEKTKIIDGKVEYQEVNPMIASLEEIEERLKRNNKLLAELRAKEGDTIDGDKKVADLQAKNKALRAEMADLKKKQEYAEALGGQTVSSRLKKKMSGNTKNPLDFEGQI